jgi:precorrin-6B methylase 2
LLQSVRVLTVAIGLVAAGAIAAVGQERAAPYEPVPYMPGRDVVWVPTPETLIEKMLDMAQVTAKDFAVDLGSGDGRLVIAAARRGAKTMGIEFNPELVLLARANAAKAGVADRASFLEADMYEADFSQASVLLLFLLPENMSVLLPKFQALKPGTRIVVNGFKMDEWEPDLTDRVFKDCDRYCVAYLYVVPARVQGVWRFASGAELKIEQTMQKIAGTLAMPGAAPAPISDAVLRGDRIEFTAAGVRHAGRVDGNRIEGTIFGPASGTWSAAR